MIHPIRPPAASEPPERPDPPEAPMLRPALNGARRFIIQFRLGTALPDVDEIPCTSAALAGIIPDDVLRSLAFSDATAWLCRLYPARLAAQMDERAVAARNDPQWSDVPLPSFARFYRLRFTGGLDDQYIVETLGRASTISAVQLELEFHVLAKAVKHNDPNYGEQDYLKAAPRGISVEAAWDEGAGGNGISIGFAEPGFNPKHQDVDIPVRLGEGSEGTAHVLNVAGILAAKDNDQGIVGVSPLSTLVFSATNAKPTPGSPAVPKGITLPHDAYRAIAMLASRLTSGDVVNFSIGAGIELDQDKSPTVAAMLPPTWDGLKIARKTGNPSQVEKVEGVLPIEIDPALLALVQDMVGRGISVCMAAGNGFRATYGKDKFLKQTVIGTDLSLNWRGQKHSLVRGDKAFRDGGGIVVSGSFWSNNNSRHERNPNFNFGDRVDCFAQSSDVATWVGANKVDRAAGTSVATPIVAGAAALVQSYLRQNYQVTLRPRFVRALLSDPLLNTRPWVPGEIGVMPNLAQIMPLLKTTSFDKKALVAQLGKQAAKTKAFVATAAKAIAAAPTTKALPIYIRDPYTIWDEAKKSWDAMPVATDTDLFNP